MRAGDNSLADVTRNLRAGNETRFEVSRPGVYDGQCAELCGENHAQMWAQVRAVPVAEYRAWAQRQAAGINDAQTKLALTREAQEKSQ